MKLSSIRTSLFTILLLGNIFACDSKHNENPIEVWLQCQMLGTCTYENTRFAMIGDSWTDFAFGTSLQRDLYDWLVVEHGYKITAANVAGQTMQAETNQYMAHRRVVENAGNQLTYMLISLGGNDMLDNLNDYNTSNLTSVTNARLQAYEENFIKLILQTNTYKSELYGGPPLKWFIHGYDYPNPELIRGCSFSSIADSEKAAAMAALLDTFNTHLRNMTYRIPNLYYIDLRMTLGGPPVSNASLKFDCIHPNEIGFKMLAARYASTLQLFTQER